MRIFAARNGYVPAAWRDAVDAPPHIRQIDVVIAAPTKADALDRLNGLGYRLHASELRVAGRANDIVAYDDADLIVPGRPLICEHAVRDAPVVAVLDGGHFRTVAHWRYARTLTLQPVDDHHDTN